MLGLVAVTDMSLTRSYLDGRALDFNRSSSDIALPDCGAFGKRNGPLGMVFSIKRQREGFSRLEKTNDSGGLST